VTVEELLALLRGIDPKVKVILEDPDTGWSMNPIVYEEDGKLIITGSYEDAHRM
jgi:hypothetical protein